METNTQPTVIRKRRMSTRVEQMQAQIDERDEIIRLLNEALSRALDELGLQERAA